MTTLSTHATTKGEAIVNDDALTLTAVAKRFAAAAGTPVLDDVSLAVGHGEFVAIVGPSGCGKTTLLRIVQGLDAPSSGAVVRRSRAEGSVPRMSYVFQRPSLLPWYSVRRNVSFGVTLAAGRDVYDSKSARESAVEELLELTGLEQHADYLPSQISGGMQQRANVARALAVRPDVLLLDEPFSALDALTRERLQIDVSAILAQLGTSAVLVTHDIREAVFMADRIAIMSSRPGRIREIVPVPEPRPRAVDFQHSERLATMERSIWHKLGAVDSGV